MDDLSNSIKTISLSDKDDVNKDNTLEDASMVYTDGAAGEIHMPLISVHNVEPDDDKQRGRNKIYITFRT